jgi:hypothetical protein
MAFKEIQWSGGLHVHKVVVMREGGILKKCSLGELIIQISVQHS